MKNMRRTRKKHFSLVEVLIVLVIIGLIMGLVGPALIGKLEDSKRKTAKSQILLLKNCIKSYYLDMGNYPKSITDLTTNPGSEKKWNGPYIEDGILPKDPWGNEFQYQQPGGDNRPYEISSYGRDNAPGGEGNDADINSSSLQ